jgi:phosphoribosylaminoimidazolecarboxamide formyltransferase/IMP cyclohydrolase
MNESKIKTALISTFYKDGLDVLVKKLHELNVQIVSTGGTYDYITSLGIPSITVESITNYPDLFEGRVKTLHPNIMGGILYRRNNSSDTEQLLQHDIFAIDLVIVDLYPFKETLENFQEESELIEKIDIGGISLIRAAAKNFTDVLIVPSRQYYSQLLELLNAKSGATDIEDRKQYAGYAFKISSEYDTSISSYFNKTLTTPFFQQLHSEVNELRYGENPHQKGYFIGNIHEIFTQLSGKELSYNNLMDIEAAVELVLEFTLPAFVIVKHSNACGVALRNTVEKAWDAALSCDPLSAFGGVICTNQEINETTANKMNDIFFEVLIAPSYTPKALEILQTKKKRIILRSENVRINNLSVKTCLNGLLIQEKDNEAINISDWKHVTKKQMPDSIISSAKLANIIVKHTKSNAIVLVKDNMLIGSGMGQTSRIDSVKLAVMKAQLFGHDTQGAVLASDAFFPFSDGLEVAFQSGIKDIIQPGGSVRDEEVISYCNNNDMTMIFTSKRHFKH